MSATPARERLASRHQHHPGASAAPSSGQRLAQAPASARDQCRLSWDFHGDAFRDSTLGSPDCGVGIPANTLADYQLHERGSRQPPGAEHPRAAPSARPHAATDGQAGGAAARHLGQPRVGERQPDAHGAARRVHRVPGLDGGDRGQGAGQGAPLPKGALPTHSRRGQVSSLLPDKIPGMQIERLELPLGSRMVGVPHTPGTREYLTCESGEIELVASGEAFRVARATWWSSAATSAIRT